MARIIGRGQIQLEHRKIASLDLSHRKVGAIAVPLSIQIRVENFSLAVEAAKVLNATVFVPTQAEKEFPVEQFTPVALDAIRELDRPLAVVFGRKTAELNTRARRFALRLSRAFEISGGAELRRP